MSRHLVTGGAGFIGSNLVRRLIAEDHEVVVLDRFSRGKQERLPAEAILVKGDIRDVGAVRRAMNGCTTVWHLAYVQGTQTFYADPKDVIDVALGGIMAVLWACEANGERPDLILVSSSEVYQSPPTGMFPTDETVPLSVPDVTNPRYSYGGGKIASELAVLAYSQAGVLDRAVVVRPHNIYGPDMGTDHVIPQFATRMMELDPPRVHAGPKGGWPSYKLPQAFPIQGTGQETRSFCHIDDCVDGLMCLYAGGGDREVYHLGNPAEEHSILALAHMVARWFDRPIEVVPGELPKGSPTRRLPDISKLAALGYKPKVSLSEGLAQTLDWYKQHNAEQVAA